MNAEPGCLEACVALLNSLFLKLKPPLNASTLPVKGSITTIPPLTSGSCLKEKLLFSSLSTYIMSLSLNNSLNSFFVQEIFSYLINPFNFFSFSISTENFSIFLTIAKSQLIDFSNLNLSNPSVQLSVLFLFNNGPRQPFLLS